MVSGISFAILKIFSYYSSEGNPRLPPFILGKASDNPAHLTSIKELLELELDVLLHLLQ